MLSARGAITTSVAMVECAGGQNMANKDVFLLSELEKVWVTHAVLARRLLLDGRGVVVQIPHFGSFWTEPQLLHVDVHRQRYATRRLCFGVCRSFATRYGVDTGKVPLEPQHGHHGHAAAAVASAHLGGAASTRRGGIVSSSGSTAIPSTTSVAVLPCRAIHTAEVVELCGVPAHTAQAALREFVLYVGEGLYRGRVFQLALPGVATLVMKREKVMLTPDAELLHDFFALDARRWPAAVREQCERAHASLLLQSRPSSSSSSTSRPVSARVSWRANGNNNNNNSVSNSSKAASVSDMTTSSSSLLPPRPTFVTACPAGRLFSDIAKEQQQRRCAQQQQQQQQDAAAAAASARHPMQRWHDMQERTRSCHNDDDNDDEYDDACIDDHDDVGGGGGGGAAQTPYSGESVYKLVADEHDTSRHGAGDMAVADAAAHASSTSHATEPEVESFEEVAASGGGGGAVVTTVRRPPRATAHVGGGGGGAHDAPHATAPRPLGQKDAQLEAVLRREERFSRPISRQTFHEQGSGSAAAATGASVAAAQPTRAGGVTAGVHGTLFYTGQTPFANNGSGSVASSSVTTSSSSSGSSSHLRHRLERPSSAPGGGAGSVAAVVASSLLGHALANNNNNSTVAITSSSPSSSSSSHSGAAVSPRLSLYSTGVNVDTTPHSSSSDVLSHVEQRLKIIKRNRVSRRGSGGRAEALVTASPHASSSSSPSWTSATHAHHHHHRLVDDTDDAADVDIDVAKDNNSNKKTTTAMRTASVSSRQHYAQPQQQRATTPPCAAYPTFHTSKLSKHEQHVLDAAAAQCLDALLFPMTS